MVGKILIVDDVATNRIVFKVKLCAACYQPLLAGDGATALRLARTEQPDLILLDMNLPDMSCSEVLAQLRAGPLTADIPVIVFSARGDSETRIHALRAGADDFLPKPVDDQILMARVRNLLRAHETLAELGHKGQTLRALGLAEDSAPFERPGLIALVVERAETALRWHRDIPRHVAGRLVIMSREEALAENTHAEVPDVFMIDADFGGAGTGLRLMSDLRSRGATRHAAVMIVQATAAADIIAMAYDLGANDAISGEVGACEIGQRLRGMMRRKRVADRLRASVQDGLRLAVIDPLTGLYNRRYALPRLGAIAERAAETGRSFAVLIVDIDRFKRVNDQWGHAAGDAVLVEVAQRMRESLRGSDLLARIGGEEFLVALPDIDLATAQMMAERLCCDVQALPIALPDGRQLSITVSIGVALGSAASVVQNDTASDVIERADHALLAAKAAGRNKVTVGRSAA